jgi:hypothetical protein
MSGMQVAAQCRQPETPLAVACVSRQSFVELDLSGYDGLGKQLVARGEVSKYGPPADSCYPSDLIDGDAQSGQALQRCLYEVVDDRLPLAFLYSFHAVVLLSDKLTVSQIHDFKSRPL